MNRKGPYDFEGGPFATLREVGKHHSVTITTARKWILAGLKAPPDRRRNPVTFGDVEYDSNVHGAKAHGVSVPTFRGWVRDGLDKPRTEWKTKPKQVKWEGKKWASNQSSLAGNRIQPRHPQDMDGQGADETARRNMGKEESEWLRK